MKLRTTWYIQQTLTLEEANTLNTNVTEKEIEYAIKAMQKWAQKKKDSHRQQNEWKIPLHISTRAKIKEFLNYIMHSTEQPVSQKTHTD